MTALSARKLKAPGGGGGVEVAAEFAGVDDAAGVAAVGCVAGASATTPCDAASTPPGAGCSGASPPKKRNPFGNCVGCAFSSFQALIAVSRQSFAMASSQPCSVSAEAASAATAFHWKNGLLVEKIQRSSGLPEKSPFTSSGPSFGS